MADVDKQKNEDFAKTMKKINTGKACFSFLYQLGFLITAAFLIFSIQADFEDMLRKINEAPHIVLKAEHPDFDGLVHIILYESFYNFTGRNLTTSSPSDIGMLAVHSNVEQNSTHDLGNETYFDTSAYNLDISGALSWLSCEYVDSDPTTIDDIIRGRNIMMYGLLIGNSFALFFFTLKEVHAIWAVYEDEDNKVIAKCGHGIGTFFFKFSFGMYFMYWCVLYCVAQAKEGELILLYVPGRAICITIALSYFSILCPVCFAKFTNGDENTAQLFLCFLLCLNCANCFMFSIPSLAYAFHYLPQFILMMVNRYSEALLFNSQQMEKVAAVQEIGIAAFIIFLVDGLLDCGLFECFCGFILNPITKQIHHVQSAAECRL